MEKANPTVSIIVPAYNVDAYIEASLRSVLGQTATDIEVIVVNDGSTDQTLETIERIATEDQRIKVITTTNRGVSSARNVGLDAATGEFILFVDGDDIAGSRLVERLLSGAGDDSVDIVMCRYKSFTDDVTFGPMSESPSYESTGKEAAIEAMLYGAKIDSGPFCKLIRASRIADTRFNSELTIGEDFDFNCQILLGGTGSIVFLDEQLYGYRIRPGSAMTSREATEYAEYLAMCERWGSTLTDKYPRLAKPVAYRLFGIASDSAGKLYEQRGQHPKEMALFLDRLKSNSGSVAVNPVPTLKNRLFAGACFINSSAAVRMRYTLSRF